MIRRVVVILDALRRDTAKWILLPFFDAKFHEVRNLGYNTPTTFKKIYSLMKEFPGWKGVITGGGYARIAFDKSNAKIDYFKEGDMYPLFNVANFLPLPSLFPTMDKNAILIIHNYFIHNYFDDVGEKGINPKDFREGMQRDLVEAYALRVQAMIPFLKRERRRFNDWEFYITADHGEAFGEEGKWHHGIKCPQTLDGFIIDFQKRDSLTLEELYTGK